MTIPTHAAPAATSASPSRTQPTHGSAPRPAAGGATTGPAPSATQMSLPNLDSRVIESLHELIRHSLDKFTGAVLIHFVNGVALDIETRTKRHLERS